MLFEGKGKLEFLKYNLLGFWFWCIIEEYCLVYVVIDDLLFIVVCCYYYWIDLFIEWIVSFDMLV